MKRSCALVVLEVELWRLLGFLGVPTYRSNVNHVKTNQNLVAHCHRSLSSPTSSILGVVRNYPVSAVNRDHRVSAHGLSVRAFPPLAVPC
jgi:hypothetical protein